MSETQEEAKPASTLARERMIAIIANSTTVINDCQKVLEILNAQPELDASFCRLFGITNQPRN